MNHMHIGYRYSLYGKMYDTEKGSVYTVALNTSDSFSCEKYQFSKSAIPPNIVFPYIIRL